MLRLLSNIQGLPVVPQNVGSPVGTIGGYVLDPADGKIVAYELTGRAKARFFSSIDVLKYFDDGVLISDPNVLQPIDELLRVKKLLESRVQIEKLRVDSEEGEKLGKATDCLIETTGHFLAKLYVAPTLPKRIFTENMIIPREHILEITPQRALVRYHKKVTAPEATVKPKVAN